MMVVDMILTKMTIDDDCNVDCHARKATDIA